AVVLVRGGGLLRVPVVPRRCVLGRRVFGRGVLGRRIRGLLGRLLGGLFRGRGSPVLAVIVRAARAGSEAESGDGGERAGAGENAPSWPGAGPGAT
ncbi:MAG: hypothetical protein Q4G40_05475, partial [Brachybacterium sp.]|nr:hypothetical protein [Brachybacterium sp.]